MYYCKDMNRIHSCHFQPSFAPRNGGIAGVGSMVLGKGTYSNGMAYLYS
jgi:hypothetical protein